MTAEAKGTSREAILDTAKDLIADGGVEQLSMRKLAAELGVAVTAIYWHIGNKQELLEAVIDHWLSDMAPISASGATSADRIMSIVRTARSQTRAHPELVALAHEHHRDSTMASPVQVALAQEVSAAGLTGDAGASAVRMLLLFSAGHVLVEAQARQMRASGNPPTSASLQALDGVDGELAAALQQPANFDALFDQSLAALVEAILS